jgi:hypothetical protein
MHSPHFGVQLPELRLNRVFRIPESLLNYATELIESAFRLSRVVVGEFAPGLLGPPLELSPSTFDLVLVHEAFLSSMAGYVSRIIVRIPN